MGPNILVSQPRPVRVKWRFPSRDHLTSSVTIWFLGAIFYRFSIATETLFPIIFEIMGILYIWVTSLTFLGHVTSSVTWLFDSPGAISYRWSIVTESLSPTIFEVMGILYIWVTSLTFLGHVTSSVTWPFDSPGAISYRCSIVTESLSPTIFEIMGILYIWVTTLSFLGHVTSIRHMSFPISVPF